MNNNDLESKVWRFLEENVIDDESFSIVALNVAKFALNNPKRIEAMAEWAKTVIRLTDGDKEKKSGVVQKYIDKMISDDGIESAFVYLSDGGNSLLFKRGDYDDITVDITDIVNSDKTGVAFNTISSIMSNILFDNPQLFADYKVEMSQIEKDLIESELAIPAPREKEYDDCDVDMVFTI
jgi:uncharacterized protein YlzI (FlbEa/FlbD family)